MLDISIAEAANAQLSNRLNEIKHNDNVVLKSDIEKLYVHEFINNFNGTTFELKYEPAPMTVLIYVIPNTPNQSYTVYNRSCARHFLLLERKVTF